MHTASVTPDCSTYTKSKKCDKVCVCLGYNAHRNKQVMSYVELTYMFAVAIWNECF